MSYRRSQRDPVGDLLIVLLVSIVLGFLLTTVWESGRAMSSCLERFSEATCNHTLGR